MAFCNMDRLSNFIKSPTRSLDGWNSPHYKKKKERDRDYERQERRGLSFQAVTHTVSILVHVKLVS